MELHSSIDCIGFMAIGALIGYLLCHVKYRVAEATAAILRGSGKVPQEFLSQESRANVVYGILALTALISVISLIGYYVTLSEKANLGSGKIYIERGWYPSQMFKRPMDEKP